MDEEKKKVTEKEGVPGKPEKKSTLKKPTPTTEKTDDGEKNAEFDIFMSDLDDRLDNLFVDIEDMSVVEDTGPKSETALPGREKERDELKIPDTVKSQKGGVVHAKPQPQVPVSIDEEKIKEAFKKPDVSVIKKKVVLGSGPQKTVVHPPGKVSKVEKGKKVDLPKGFVERQEADKKKVQKTDGEDKRDPGTPVGIAESFMEDIEIIEDYDIINSEKRQKSIYRNKFVLGAILAVLVVAVSFIIFKPFAGVEGDVKQTKIITRQTDKPPAKIQAKTAMPSSDTVNAKKAEPVVHRNTAPSTQVPEEKEGGVSIKKETEVFKAPAMSVSSQIPEAKKDSPSVEKERDVLKAPALSYPYSIHAGSYRSLKSADLSAETYRKTGLQAFWVRIDLGEKGVWYRVFIDCYKDPVMAQEIIKEKQLKDANPIRVKYANFIGAYLSDDDLKKQSRLLSERGYSPYFIRDDNGKNYLYAGAFDTLKEAEKFSVELSSRGIRSLVVER